MISMWGAEEIEGKNGKTFLDRTVCKHSRLATDNLYTNHQGQYW